jgi:hypothetical protein
MTVKWSEVFHRSRLAPAAFLVTSSHQGDVFEWLTGQKVASCRASGMYSSLVDGWAVLDGGVTHISRYGLTSLPDGIRIIGWQTLRLLIHDLNLAPPNRALLQEPMGLGVEELLLRHRVATPDDDRAKEQAEILTTCDDGPSLQWAVKQLIGDKGLPSKRAPTGPAAGTLGALGLTAEDAEMLVGAADVEAITQAVHYLASAAKETQLADLARYPGGIWPERQAARTVLGVLKAGIPSFKEWVAAGFHPGLVGEALVAGVSLEAAKNWLGEGAHARFILDATNAGVTLEQLKPFRALSIGWPTSLHCVELGVSIEEIQAHVSELVNASDAAVSLVLERSRPTY